MVEKPWLTAVARGQPLSLYLAALRFLGLFNERTRSESHEMQHPSSTIAPPVPLGVEACSRQKRERVKLLGQYPSGLPVG
jgi:hypothetical protein